MKFLFVALAFANIVGVAHAEKFDVLCDGEYQYFYTASPASGESTGVLRKVSRQYRISIDTDASRVRATKTGGEWERSVELRTHPDRYNFDDGHGRWVVERESGHAGFNIQKAGETGAFTGDCKREKYTAIPDMKF